ncbi:hypothetical protein DFP72DRAFT_859843 [Ephemerocybe angulata]|uniref:Uncharacterized protein n=1 Tax=Ephemerocybe angulata TaxID=980116 RepID=A0A8H6HAV6_9AGAR|nr:hypothetical protein DFP72DRAFT_859843 [Tulosesus angulatus]
MVAELGLNKRPRLPDVCMSRSNVIPVTHHIFGVEGPSSWATFTPSTLPRAECCHDQSVLPIYHDLQVALREEPGRAAGEELGSYPFCFAPPSFASHGIYVTWHNVGATFAQKLSPRSSTRRVRPSVKVTRRVCIIYIPTVPRAPVYTRLCIPLRNSCREGGQTGYTESLDCDKGARSLKTRPGLRSICFVTDSGVTGQTEILPRMNERWTAIVSVWLPCHPLISRNPVLRIQSPMQISLEQLRNRAPRAPFQALQKRDFAARVRSAGKPESEVYVPGTGVDCAVALEKKKGTVERFVPRGQALVGIRTRSVSVEWGVEMDKILKYTPQPGWDHLEGWNLVRMRWTSFNVEAMMDVGGVPI